MDRFDNPIELLDKIGGTQAPSSSGKGTICFAGQAGQCIAGFLKAISARRARTIIAGHSCTD